MFGKRGLSQEYAGIIRQIEEGERQRPRHQRPKSLRDGGWSGLVTRPHEIVFADFDWFGPFMNSQISEPWTVEETADTVLRGFEGPDLGRSYRVFYNAAKMGRVQISIAGAILNDEEFARSPQARATVELTYLRFIPYTDAFRFVFVLELVMGRFEEMNAANARANAAATAVLTGHLWETVRNEDVVVEFEHSVAGPYELLRHTTAHWKKGGIDPFRDWGGDRGW